MRSPARGQYGAETTAIRMNRTTNSSPLDRPNTGTPDTTRCYERNSEAMTIGAYDCVVGLGSNEGDRRMILSMALDFLATRALVTGTSSLYETEPIGGPEQSDYLNAAARLKWSFSLPELLTQLLEIETRFGRQRTGRWAARTLDLDVLWVDKTSLNVPGLTLPHPRLSERAFALVPLLEVAPRAIDPASGVPYSALAMPPGRVRCVASAGWWRPRSQAVR